VAGSATDWESDMKTQIQIFEFKHLIVMTAHGTVDLSASKAALKSLVADPGFDASPEVLIDLRDTDCDISVTDVFELVKHMALSIPALSQNHRIAVLVKRHAPANLVFNYAQFLELCADNRGLNIRAYGDYNHAIDWLDDELPDSPQHAAPTRTQPHADSRLQAGLG
jgi:hypothetical protein